MLICLSGSFFIFNPSTTVCLLVLAAAEHAEVVVISILNFLYVLFCLLLNEYFFGPFRFFRSSAGCRCLHMSGALCMHIGTQSCLSFQCSTSDKVLGRDLWRPSFFIFLMLYTAWEPSGFEVFLSRCSLPVLLNKLPTHGLKWHFTLTVLSGTLKYANLSLVNAGGEIFRAACWGQCCEKLCAQPAGTRALSGGQVSLHIQQGLAVSKWGLCSRLCPWHCLWDRDEDLFETTHGKSNWRHQ